ncbi:MAG: S1 RNA-binding domain-containing protein [Bacilli bacterium]|jgi:predicted RNA-binding protein with RPS1 domain|nr:S1 RNA-binding domain-containing protein [Bacilli bacterium]
MNEKIQHKIGDRVVVTISSIVPYGAFADLEDGGSGLIHISEIDEKFISNIADYLPLKTSHEVIVTGLGKKPYTYALSLKRISRRPRQKQLQAKKPLSRKSFNKEMIDSYPFKEMESALPSMICNEAARLGVK